MTRKYRFRIAKKRLVKETEKAYVFNTSRFNGELFNIPKSKVYAFEESSIAYSESHDEPAYLLSVDLFFINHHNFKRKYFKAIGDMQFIED